MFKDQPLVEKKALVRAMIERMARAYGVNKKDLPHLLQCSRNVMNNWVYYARVPLEQLDICRHQTGVSMDWLMYGDDAPQDELLPSEQLQSIINKVFEHSIALELISTHSADAINHISHKLSKDIVTNFALSTRLKKPD